MTPISDGASSNPADEVNTQKSGSSIPYGLEVNVLRFRGRGRDRKSLHLSDRKKTSAASWHKKQFLNSFSKIFCFPNKSFWKWIFRIKIVKFYILVSFWKSLFDCCQNISSFSPITKNNFEKLWLLRKYFKVIFVLVARSEENQWWNTIKTQMKINEDRVYSNVLT